MTELILKSSVGIAAAYLFYHLFLKNNRNFNWLRIYLISSVVVSFVLPSLKYLQLFHPQTLVYVPVLSVAGSYKASPFSLFDLLKCLYIIGLSFFLIKFLVGIFQLIVLIIRHKIKRVGIDYFVIVKDLPCPFSFFHLIFIDNKDLSDAGRGAILQHEREHVHQWHSLDLILLELLTAIQWFNPFAWLISSSLKEIHEFSADERTIRERYSLLEYQQLLISQTFGLKFNTLANGFNSSLIKKRIRMISTNKNRKKWSIVLAILAVAIAAIVSLSNINIIAQEIPKAKKTEKVTQKNNTNNKIVSRDTLAPPPPPPPPPPVEKTVKFTAPVVVDEDTVKHK